MLKKFVSLNRSISDGLVKKFPRFFKSPSYKGTLEDLISADIQRLKAGSIVLEVGGIDRPLISRNEKYEYVGIDIEERPDCHSVYDQFIVQSIEDPVNISADMVISITLLEHVPDNTKSIKSIYDSLVSGGMTHHYIPSKWHPYSVVLRLVGPNMQKKLIAILRPDAADVTGYPAFFSHCSPGGMRKVFLKNGFQDVEVKPFYRANDYFAFFVPAFLIITLYENICALLNIHIASSGFVISAKKPL